MERWAFGSTSLARSTSVIITVMVMMIATVVTAVWCSVVTATVVTGVWRNDASAQKRSSGDYQQEGFHSCSAAGGIRWAEAYRRTFMAAVRNSFTAC